VSQALMLENQQLRALIDNLETISKEQTETIKLLCDQDLAQLTEINSLKQRLDRGNESNHSRVISLSAGNEGSGSAGGSGVRIDHHIIIFSNSSGIHRFCREGEDAELLEPVAVSWIVHVD